MVRKEGISAEERRLRDVVAAYWRPHRDLQRFLGDHFPEEWEVVRRCGMTFRHGRDRNRGGIWRVLPRSCHAEPFCIRCSDMKRWGRVRAVQDRFLRCTPAGRQPRFVHVVQVAEVGRDGTGWGVSASRNIRRFGEIVFKQLRWAYGNGIGCYMSYQDFGEKGFVKRWPHMDLTLNGWLLDTDGSGSLPYYDFEHGGRDRWRANFQRLGLTLDLAAEGGNVQVQGIAEGLPVYVAALKYQLRELVDFRKLRYDRATQTVRWVSYKSSGKGTVYSIRDFLGGFFDYQLRLGQWRTKEQGGQDLHSGYGHMSDRSVGATERALGGRRLNHGRQCSCSECRDWEWVDMSRDDRRYAEAS